jgi:hypothetical protein
MAQQVTAQETSDRLIPIPRVVGERGRRGFVAGILFGAVLGIPFLIVSPFFSDEVVTIFYGVFVGMVASVYLGFALSDGRYKAFNIETLIMISFGVLATVAIMNNEPMLIAAGFLGHALWDALHPHPMSTAMPPWYVPACIGMDVVLAAYLFVRFV